MRLKGHTRLWGYNAVRSDKSQELTDILIAAENPVRFSVSGGRILVVDNADLQDLEPYRTDGRRAFNGHGIAIIRSDRPGRLRVVAAADGLRSASVVVRVVRGSDRAVGPAGN